ncbi:MAG: efflux RND transporter periplasmic adaptor subunit [Gammaproteobacteria bacterium]|nr:efflux RND transporter periplasmic adaptor subunit [Gammaproteobacteria bacterium]
MYERFFKKYKLILETLLKKHMPKAKALAQKNKWLTITAMILIVWLFLVFIMRGYDAYTLKKAALAEDIFPVSIVQPKKNTSIETIELPGNIMAWNQSYIYSRVNGYIKAWYTDYGARVEKDQIMAKVRTPILNARYGQAKADMKSQEAIYKLAELTANRYIAMKKSEAVSIQSISVKEAHLKAEKAKFNATEYRVETLGARLKFKSIVAPFSGIVISRNINLGDYVSDKGSVEEQSPKPTHLFIVADIKKLRLFVSIPERFGRFLKPGFKADVVFPQYPNRHYAGHFLTSAKAFDPQTRTVVTEFVLDNENEAIWPGSYATVTISAKTQSNLLSLPTTAMIFDAHGTRVATLGEDNTVHFKDIKVEQLRKRTVEVLEGLSPTDKVINSPNLGLLEGSKVKVVTPVTGYLQ